MNKLNLVGELLVGLITVMFNKIFQNQIFPPSWNKADIIPIFKKDKGDNTENYKPIKLCNKPSEIIFVPN